MTASYRATTPDDHDFIVSGWSSSYRLSRDIAFIQMAGYADVMHPIIKSVLARPRVEVIVAHGEVLRGFICFERPDLVNYVYVAQPYRRKGIAAGLFAAAGIDHQSRFRYAARTRASWELMVVHGKAPLSQHDPFPSRFTEEKAP